MSLITRYPGVAPGVASFGIHSQRPEGAGGGSPGGGGWDDAEKLRGPGRRDA